MKILSHPGLGDHFIINGMVRSYAVGCETVSLAAKQGYIESLRFLYRDVSNVSIAPIPQGADPYQFQNAWSHEADACDDGARLRLGQFGASWHQLLRDHEWDQVFYLQAEVPLEARWNRCRVVRDPEREYRLSTAIACPAGPYQVVHEDRERGFQIDRRLLDQRLPVVEVDQALTQDMTENIFDFLGVLENAKTIHCFPSSFFLLVDHFLSTFDAQLFLHDYVRPVPMGGFGKNWTVVKVHS